jgi:hypothetical protein
MKEFSTFFYAIGENGGIRFLSEKVEIGQTYEVVCK